VKVSSAAHHSNTPALIQTKYHRFRIDFRFSLKDEMKNVSQGKVNLYAEMMAPSWGRSGHRSVWTDINSYQNQH
jgi:hypothetical protein